MGSKIQPGKFDCYANALPDEPMFVLLARDPDIQCGLRPQSDAALVAEAEECAWAGQEWRRKNDGAWRK
jgi:hypothetical protein